MLRRLLLLIALLLAAVAGGGVAVSRIAPALSTAGPTTVSGTEESITFQIADRLVRQIRYDDGGTLRYTFNITNDGRVPVTIRGLADDQPVTRLFTYVGLTGADGADDVNLGAGESTELTLALKMGGCETLSARAGAFVTEVIVRTERVGLFGQDVRITLPEEVHTGSPREAFCPNSTATSRPPG